MSRPGRRRPGSSHVRGRPPAAAPPPARAVGPPPGDQGVEALVEADPGLEAGQLAGEADIGEAARHRVDAALRLVDRHQVGPAHHGGEPLRQFEERGLFAAPDIERDVARRGERRQDVGPGDVAHVDEVHGLQAVAEDQRRLTPGDPLHPADQDLGVAPVQVHARAVDVEVAQGDVVEPVHVVGGAQQALAEALGRAVERAVAGMRLGLRGREGRGHAVDRGRGGVDDLADLLLDAELDEARGRVDHHLDRLARLGGAVGDAQRRLVEDGVAARHQPGHQVAVADVADDELDRARGHGAGEVLGPAPDQVVDHHDLAAAPRDQKIDDVGADEAGPAGDEDPIERAARLDERRLTRLQHNHLPSCR